MIRALQSVSGKGVAHQDLLVWVQTMYEVMRISRRPGVVNFVMF